MIRAAFFDVDGTLLSHKTKSVPESTREALAKLREKGILCIIATGRQYIQLGKLPVGDIPFDAYITVNGQMTVDGAGRIEDAVPISGVAKDYLVRCFNDHTFPALFVEADRLYLNYISDHVLSVQEAISTPTPPLGEYTGNDIYQACVYLRPFEEHLLDSIAEESVLSRWTYGGIDVVGKGGGKVRGIQRYLEEHGISREETIAFGDGENDTEMLRFAGIGVAMGNSEAVTKAAADYVTADIDEAGLALALKHFGLID